MKAAIIKTLGQRAPEIGMFDDPVAGDGEAVIRIAAAAVTPLARARAAGHHYSSGTTLPFVAGVDGVGTLADGSRVAFALPRSPFGAMAEATVVPQANIVPVPAALDDIAAAALINPGMSSWAALTERARLRRGETVLVNGATGAAGQIAIHVARHLGASRVIATGRNEAALAALGADEVIVLGENPDTLEKRLLPVFEGRVDVIIDYLWGMSAERLLIAGAKAGAGAVPIRFVQVGSISGADIALPSAVLRSSAIELMGSGLGSMDLSRVIAAVGGMLEAAAQDGFRLPFQAAPLEQIEALWNSADARVVLKMEAGNASPA